MKIQNTNNLNFNAKYDTAKILQITTQRIFEKDGMDGHIAVLKDLYGSMPKYLGCRGYKGIAQTLSKRIVAKYPQIAQATREINKIINKSNPSSKELREKILPIIEKIGKEVDIVI